MSHRYPMSVAWSHEDKAFIAVSPVQDFHHLSGIGETQEAAVRELSVAIDLTLRVLAEDGIASMKETR
jgi:predicted RNase H-like HicB family nuclease